MASNLICDVPGCRGRLSWSEIRPYVCESCLRIIKRSKDGEVSYTEDDILACRCDSDYGLFCLTCNKDWTVEEWEKIHGQIRDEDR